jgi:hypothetical protein
MMPCSRAAPMSWRAPGSAAEAQINRPAGSVMTCTFTPWHLCLPEKYGRSRPDPMPTRSMRSKVPSRITNAFRTATATASRKVGASERGQDLDGLGDVAEHRGRADAEPGGQVSVGLALAQVRHHEQGLFADGQAPPPGPHLCTAVAQRVGQREEGVVGHGDPGGVGRHPKLLVWTS